MPKLMIVEDNMATREGLRDNINWAENGIELGAVLTDGQEAIDQLNSYKPDIIVTDIIMPKMDGLSLAEKVKEKYPDIKIIILSAYEEFEYAQEALKTGVFDYIMKPFDYGQLLQSVKNAFEVKKRDDFFREQVEKSKPVLREKFLIQLIEDDYDDIVFMKDAKYLDLKFDFEKYLFVLFEIDNIKQVKSTMKMVNYNVLLLKIIEIIEEKLVVDGKWVFRIKNNYIGCIIGLRFDYPDTYNIINEKLEDVRSIIYKTCGVTVCIGVGKLVTAITNIYYSYRKAKDSLDYKFILGENRIFSSNDLERNNTSEGIFFPLLIEDRFIKRVCLGDLKESVECLDELFDCFKNNSAEEEYIKTTITALTAKMFQTLIERGIKTDKITTSRTSILKDIQNANTINKLYVWLKELITNICNEIMLCMSQQYRGIINSVTDYIDKSYMNENISLNEIAKVVSLSPTYLSGVFKRETKMNISDYILQVRMEKAQKLLMNYDYKISEVSQKVGYSNQFYFSTCFKKFVGQSPNEFRNKQS